MYMQNNVHLLSSGPVLHGFVECLEEIPLFWAKERSPFQQCVTWICGVMFPYRFSLHLNDLDTNLPEFTNN